MAVAAYEQALTWLDAADPMHHRVTAELAASQWEAGHHSDGIRGLRDALEVAVRAGDVRAQGVATSNLGVMHHLAGNHVEARRLHERALDRHRQAGHDRFEAIAQFDLAGLAHELGASERAADLYQRAIDGLDTAKDARLSALAQAALAAVQARLGRSSEPDATSIAAELEAGGHPLFARGAWLYARLVAVLATPESFDPSDYEQQPDEVQLPARLLGQLSASMERGEVLRAGVALDRFCVGAGDWVDLSSRTAYRGIFAMLCTRRLRGQPDATLDDLVAAGWPGERVSADAARNRAHVALSSLRRLGLAGILQKQSGGYALSVRVPLLITGSI